MTKAQINAMSAKVAIMQYFAPKKGEGVTEDYVSKEEIDKLHVKERVELGKLAKEAMLAELDC